MLCCGACDLKPIFHTMEFTLSETNRGKKSLLYEQNTYRVDRITQDDCISWRCTMKTCKGRLRTNSSMTEITSLIQDHNHDVDSKKIVRQQLRVAVKREAPDEFTSRPSKVIRRELHRFNDELLDTRDIKNVAQSLYRERRKTYPALPKDRAEVHEVLKNIDTQTKKGENFILENNQDTGIIILTCETNLKFLADSTEEIFVDGTFKSCPKYFFQLYSIHGMKNGHFIPLVFALLPGKTEEIYRLMWTSLINICSSKNLVIKVPVIHVDFEYAMYKILIEIFFDAKIKFCRFHLGQAWWRKIQSLGLSLEYKDNDSEIGKWLKSFFGLHFLEPADVEECFVEDLMTIAPQDERCVKFADYLVDNYLTAESKYPPSLWAETPSTNKRTTNSVESFHAHLNAQFYMSHPSIFIFMDVLQKLQSITYVKMRSCHQPRRPEKSEREKVEFSIAQFEKFEKGDLTRHGYLKSVGYRFGAKIDL